MPLILGVTPVMSTPLPPLPVQEQFGETQRISQVLLAYSPCFNAIDVFFDWYVERSNAELVRCLTANQECVVSHVCEWLTGRIEVSRTVERAAICAGYPA